MTKYKEEWGKLDKALTTFTVRGKNMQQATQLQHYCGSSQCTLHHQFHVLQIHQPGTKETQNVYDEKRKEKTKEWEGEVKAYMELPKWKDREIMTGCYV